MSKIHDLAPRTPGLELRNRSIQLQPEFKTLMTLNGSQASEFQTEIDEFNDQNVTKKKPNSKSKQRNK
jgi:hypothetical protein